MRLMCGEATGSGHRNAQKEMGRTYECAHSLNSSEWLVVQKDSWVVELVVEHFL